MSIHHIIPLIPKNTTKRDAVAVQALARGNATDDQQRHALQWMVDSLCGTYTPSYVSEKPYDTAFAEGKRNVGLQIVQLVNLDLSRIKE